MGAKSGNNAPVTSIILPGLCRFCGNNKNGRLINVPYEYLGQKEIYSDMLMECFGLQISPVVEPVERLVCATCVVRLRGCVAFKKQVMCAEQKFLLRLKQAKVEEDIKSHDSDSDGIVVEAMEDTYSEDEGIKDIIPQDTQVAKSCPKIKDEVNLQITKVRAKKKVKRNRTPKLPVSPDVAIKEEMALENTCTIVKSSYVCPFNNITGNYYCFYCRAIFIVPEDLRDHTLTHDPKTFAQNTSSKKAVKIDLTRIDCRLCKESITDLDQLKQHLSSKHGVKMHPVDNEFLRFKLTHPTLSCLECGDNFYFVDKLIDHMAGHFGSFICEVCGATFVQASSLDSHVRCHEPKRRFECKVCGKSRSTNRAIYVHIKTVHEKKPVIDCLKCEGKFFTYDARNKHMVADHAYNMSFPCNVCGRVFDARKKFLTHNRTAHLKQYSHQCQLCEKKFFSSTHLKRHLKTHR